MDNVNKTLYIPLYGKSFVSKKGIILRDAKAEEIWDAEGFPLKGKSRTKWLAYYMAMRAATFDRWLAEKIGQNPEGVVLHIGCGMDSRIERVGDRAAAWFDVDFPEVIDQRKRYFAESETYRMISGDLRDGAFLKEVPGGVGIVVMEGISMYLKPQELKAALEGICTHFDRIYLLMDCYSVFAAKASKYKNPIRDVGVTEVYGLDDPRILTGKGLEFVREQIMTPEDLIDQLEGLEQKIFRKLYAGKTAGKMYRMYEFEGGRNDSEG